MSHSRGIFMCRSFPTPGGWHSSVCPYPESAEKYPGDGMTGCNAPYCTPSSSVLVLLMYWLKILSIYQQIREHCLMSPYAARFLRLMMVVTSSIHPRCSVCVLVVVLIRSQEVWSCSAPWRTALPSSSRLACPASCPS